MIIEKKLRFSSQLNIIGTEEEVVEAFLPIDTVPSANAIEVSNAILAQGSGDIVVQSLSGSLDPLVTPELTVSIEEFEELSSDDFDFDDLEDELSDELDQLSDELEALGHDIRHKHRH